MLQNNNSFSHEHFIEILTLAITKNYKFCTIYDYLNKIEKKDNEKYFLLKHDLDAKPLTLKPLLDIQKSLGIRSTIYARVSANDYNLLDYKTYPMLRQAEEDGFEIGLHTNFIEYSTINHLNQENFLSVEVNLMKSLFKRINGLSTHRDLNYAYNALPYIEKHWERLKVKHRLNYQAYDKRLMENMIYVNEGYSPHLCWRNLTPEQAIETGKDIYMLTHPHWWWEEHPFETW